MKDNIILIGFMGCGKTTVGKQLAKRLGYQFLDTDQYIEDKSKMKISHIFAEYGEEYFRALETAAVKKLIETTHKTVISSGGGLPLREENARLLQELGQVFFLNVSKEEVYRRLKGDTTRPLLRGKNPEEKIDQMMKYRVPIYKNAAEYEINVDKKNVEELVNEIELVSKM
ncbi:shikimate kinase I [Lachnospiraceae bacterium KM106-2]|nr:shikimate kinase I [Lachnospiraceae bacterium KM106-2]